jgi:hypothetical protein
MKDGPIPAPETDYGNCPWCLAHELEIEMLPLKMKDGNDFFCPKCNYGASLDVYLRTYAPDIEHPKDYGIDTEKNPPA